MALPSGYTRLDYIEATGTQYINTEFIPNGNSRIVMDCEPTSVDNTFGFFCARTATSATDTTANVLFCISGKYRKDFYGTSKATSGAYAAGKRITIDSNKNNVSIGTDYSLVFTASMNASPMALLLMATAVPGSTAGTFTNIANFAKMKLYSAKIYDNGTLVRDFIPCKNASGTIGLWDNVNSVFYANAGTGTFSTGKKHKTLIDGTGYEIKSGRVLIAGTGYDIKKGRTLIGGTGYDIKFGVPVGELAVGTSVFMNVNGVRKEFIVGHQGNLTLTYSDSEFSSGTWLLMRDIYALNTFYKLEDVFNEFLSKLDATIQALAKPIRHYNGIGSKVTGKVATPTISSIEGDSRYEYAKMDYFTTKERNIAFFNGEAEYWWLDVMLRYSSSLGENSASVITKDGSRVETRASYENGFRPLLVLPPDVAKIDDDFNIIPA